MKTFTPTPRETRTVRFSIASPGGDDGLEKLTKAKLLDQYADTVDLNPRASKKDIIAAIREKVGGATETYQFAIPKLGPVIAATQSGDKAERDAAAEEWLRRGLGDEAYDRIQGRLADYDDPFDADDLADLVQWLVAQASDRPTRRRNG